MSARSGGSFATLLMTGPLAAIPLMAVFGVPQFPAVSASADSRSEDVRRQPPSSIAAADGPFAAQGTSPHNADTNGFVFAARQPTHTSAGRAPRPPTHPSIVQAIPSAQSPVPSQPRAPASSASIRTGLRTTASVDTTAAAVPAAASRPRPTALGSGQSPPAEEISAGLSWQQAAQRLQQLGIEDYRLERGHESGSFLFVCQFELGGDSRIVRRFEAETTEPLLAVQQVLARIEDWQTHMNSSAAQ